MANTRKRRAGDTVAGGDLGDAPRRSSSGGLFAWTVGILFLVALALACWIGSYYVFGHPEKAFSYSLLTRLGKLDEPKRFELTAAPRGEFLSPAKLAARFEGMSPRELARESEGFLRNYIRNYKLTGDLVPYVVGDFVILDSYELGAADFFPSGVVVVAQSKENPQILVEHIFSADAKVVPVLHRMLLTGLDLQLKAKLDMSALLNVSRTADGKLVFTAIPLLYGSYATTGGAGTFSLEPPKSLNVAAGLPVKNPEAVSEALKKFAAYQRKTGVAGRNANPFPVPARQGQQLVRVDRPEPVNPADRPEEPQATPTPVPSPTPALAQATPPQPTPSPSPTSTPGETPAAAIASTAGGSWPVYDPGMMPRGRLLNIPDMPELASRGLQGERLYLQGNFVVTASGQNRAVLRSQAAIAETLGLKGRTTNVRIIAEFPSGAKPPSEGSSFSRDLRRPFQITDIRESGDGQVNVYVREVTR